MIFLYVVQTRKIIRSWSTTARVRGEVEDKLVNLLVPGKTCPLGVDCRVAYKQTFATGENEQFHTLLIRDQFS